MSKQKHVPSVTCQSVFEKEVVTVQEKKHPSKKNQIKKNNQVLFDAETNFEVEKFLTKRQKKELRKRSKSSNKGKY